MGDSEERNGGNFNKGRLVFVLLSLIFAFSIGFYVSAYGASLPGFFKDATAIVSQTLRGVLGSGPDKEKSFEVDLSSLPMKSDGAGGKLKETKETAPPQSGSGANNKDEVATVAQIKNVSKSAENSGEAKLSGAPVSSGASAALAATTSQSISKENVAAAPDCDFLSVSTPDRKIVFNEIAWMGSPQRAGETSAVASNNEWMELKNLSQASVDLVGWQILDESEKFNVIFDGGKISANGFYLLERSDDDSVPGIPAEKIYNGALSNSGMWLKLLDKDCALVDEINATSGWPGGDNSAKKTLERNSGGGDWPFDAAPASAVASAGRQGWHTSLDAGGTPKKENSKPVAVAAGDPNAKYSLGVLLNGDGSGAVYSSPAGISCAADCSEEYLRGTQLVLTASSSPNSSFLGWSGACVGTSNCKLTVTSTLSVTASFKSLAPPSVSVSPSPPPPPATAAGQQHVLISEIFYDAVGSDDGKEFIELYNPAAGDSDLKDWSLKNGTSSLVSIGSKSGDKTVIKSKGYFLVGLASYNGSPTADVVRSASLPNSSATIVLANASGAIVDSVSYNNSVSPGQSYERSPLDGNQFVAQSNPTPQNSGL